MFFSHLKRIGICQFVQENILYSVQMQSTNLLHSMAFTQGILDFLTMMVKYRQINIV